MTPITRIEGTGVPLDGDNIDTDQIISGRFLYAPRDELDYGRHFLYDSRFADDGQHITGHPLNDPAYQGARVLLVDANFGYGSSRTQAAWAVQDYGIQAIVGMSFGSVFASNCALHGLATVAVEPAAVKWLKDRIRRQPNLPIAVDLDDMALIAGNTRYPAHMDAIDRHRLTTGEDDFAMTRSVADDVMAFRSAYDEKFPWVR